MKNVEALAIYGRNTETKCLTRNVVIEKPIKWLVEICQSQNYISKTFSVEKIMKNLQDKTYISYEMNSEFILKLHLSNESLKNRLIDQK